MVNRRLALALFTLCAANALAFPPPRVDRAAGCAAKELMFVEIASDDGLDLDLDGSGGTLVEQDIGDGWVDGREPANELASEIDIDELLESPPDVSRPLLPRWQLATRDALTFDTWPPDLDQGNAAHRDAMDMVDRGIVPLRDGLFRPELTVSRVELLEWVDQVEDWVRIAQSGLSLDVKLHRARKPSLVRPVLRLGLVTEVALDGDRPVTPAFVYTIRERLERVWGMPNSSAENLIDLRPSTRERGWLATWLRGLAQRMCRDGRAPTDSIDTRSLAHVAPLLRMLEDSSAIVRQAAHRALAGTDPSVLATLIAARKGEWYRDPAALETLPEVAIQLGGLSEPRAAAQFEEAMRILRGLKDARAEARFITRVAETLARTPSDSQLPAKLIAESVSIMVAHNWTNLLDDFLHWGMPVLEAIVPHLEGGAIDRHWAERMPYSLEPGWDSRGRGVPAQLRLLIGNNRLLARTRAAALDRLQRLGETITRDQARALGVQSNDPDGAQEQLALAAARALEPAPRAKPGRQTGAQEAEIVRLTAMVQGYQFYLAIMVTVLILIVGLHALILIPLMIFRVVRRIRGWLIRPDLCGRVD